MIRPDLDDNLIDFDTDDESADVGASVDALPPDVLFALEDDSDDDLIDEPDQDFLDASESEEPLWPGTEEIMGDEDDLIDEDSVGDGPMVQVSVSTAPYEVEADFSPHAVTDEDIDALAGDDEDEPAEPDDDTDPGLIGDDDEDGELEEDPDEDEDEEPEVDPTSDTSPIGDDEYADDMAADEEDDHDVARDVVLDEVADAVAADREPESSELLLEEEEPPTTAPSDVAFDAEVLGRAAIEDAKKEATVVDSDKPSPDVLFDLELIQHRAVPAEDVVFDETPAMRAYMGERAMTSRPFLWKDAKLDRTVREWEINFGPVSAPAGKKTVITYDAQLLFRGEKCIATDTATPAGSGTRITKVSVGMKLQRAATDQGTLTSFFPTFAFGNGMKWDTVQPGLSIAVEVSFVQSCTFDMSVFGRAIL